MHVPIATRRADMEIGKKAISVSVMSLFLLLAVGGAAQETSPLPPALRYTVVTAIDGNGDTQHGCCRVNNNEAVSKKEPRAKKNPHGRCLPPSLIPPPLFNSGLHCSNQPRQPSDALSQLNPTLLVGHSPPISQDRGTFVQTGRSSRQACTATCEAEACCVGIEWKAIPQV